MFEAHFGLRENPFVSGHQSRFVFPSREHQEALAHLRFGIENREPFVLITGEVGTGKTTALYDALSEWQSRAAIALITNSALTRAELLEEISLKFGLPLAPPVSKPQVLGQLERHLLALRAKGDRAILLLDEAQNLGPDLLEEIRLLSNLEAQGEKLVQVFLIGQPELEAKLARPELRQLRQRIAVHYRIRPLGAEDTERYIHHRITVAGGYAPDVFPHDACEAVWRLTHGIPREINQVCAQAMLSAFVEDARGVRPEHVSSAASESQFRSVAETPAAAMPAREERVREERVVEAPRQELPVTEPLPATPPAQAQMPPASVEPPVDPPRASVPTFPTTSPPPATTPANWQAWLESLANGVETSGPSDAAPRLEADDPAPPAMEAHIEPERERPSAVVMPIAEELEVVEPAIHEAPPEPARIEPVIASSPRPRLEQPAPVAASSTGIRSDDWRPPAWSAERHRAVEMDDTRDASSTAVRWVVVAVVLAIVTVAGVLAVRFLPRARRPEAVQPVASAPANPAATPGPEMTAPADSAPKPAPAVVTRPRPTQKPATTDTSRSRPALPKTPFALAVGTFIDRARADTERTRLVSIAPAPVRVITMKSAQGEMYALLVGTFTTRLAAEEAASDLVKRGVVDEARIVASRPRAQP